MLDCRAGILPRGLNPEFKFFLSLLINDLSIRQSHETGAAAMAGPSFVFNKLMKAIVEAFAQWNNRTPAKETKTAHP